MPWCEGKNLHGFTMKPCCVKDTRTRVYSNWHNRVTICVVMRKSYLVEVHPVVLNSIIEMVNITVKHNYSYIRVYLLIQLDNNCFGSAISAIIMSNLKKFKAFFKIYLKGI
jgi:hypothetical protein